MDSFNSLPIHQALTAWDSHLQRATTLVDGLTDEQLHAAIAPGKNRGVYLLGHLIAVHDDMLALLGLGERRHPELDAAFLRNPDRSDLPVPPLAELRPYWREVHEALTAGLRGLAPADWLAPHARVSAEDFAREPHRNRLNVLLSRTTHLAYHTGQLVLLK